MKMLRWIIAERAVTFAMLRSLESVPHLKGPTMSRPSVPMLPFLTTAGLIAILCIVLFFGSEQFRRGGDLVHVMRHSHLLLAGADPLATPPQIRCIFHIRLPQRPS